MPPKTNPTQRPTMPPMVAPIFIFSTVEGSIVSSIVITEGRDERKGGKDGIWRFL